METSLQSKGWSNELLRPAAAQISVANESFPLVVFQGVPTTEQLEKILTLQETRSSFVKQTCIGGLKWNPCRRSCGIFFSFEIHAEGMMWCSLRKPNFKKFSRPNCCKYDHDLQVVTGDDMKLPVIATLQPLSFHAHLHLVSVGGTS